MNQYYQRNLETSDYQKSIFAFQGTQKTISMINSPAKVLFVQLNLDGKIKPVVTEKNETEYRHKSIKDFEFWEYLDFDAKYRLTEK